MDCTSQTKAALALSFCSLRGVGQDPLALSAQLGNVMPVEVRCSMIHSHGMGIVVALSHDSHGEDRGRFEGCGVGGEGVAGEAPCGLLGPALSVAVPTPEGLLVPSPQDLLCRSGSRCVAL